MRASAFGPFGPSGFGYVLLGYVLWLRAFRAKALRPKALRAHRISFYIICRGPCVWPEKSWTEVCCAVVFTTKRSDDI
jgi:hypothetical protein